MTIKSEKCLSITFKNTPLQNLRNILIEADSSANSANKKINRAAVIQSNYNKEQAVSKTDLKEIVSGLKSIPRQYVAKFEISMLFLNLCEKKQENRNLDIMKTLENIINDKILS